MASSASSSPEKSVVETSLTGSPLKWPTSSRHPARRPHQSGNTSTNPSSAEPLAQTPKNKLVIKVKDGKYTSIEPETNQQENHQHQNPIESEAEKKPTDGKESEAEKQPASGDESEGDAAVAAALAAEEVVSKPSWNLRPRRPVVKPNGKESAMKTGAPVPQHNTFQETAGSSRGGQKKKKTTKPRLMDISLTLTKEEIEADFIAMTGKKPPRKLKKRPKAVQKQIDNLTPGSHLDEISPKDYRVV